MRRRLAFLMVLAAPFAAPAAALANPVEITRFVSAEAAARLGQGAVAVVPVAGGDPQSLVDQPWIQAVQRELAAQGYGAATPGAADVLAEVTIEREATVRGGSGRGPVSVGVGGATGSYGGGLGLGLGFNFGGGPRRLDATRLRVVLRDRLSGAPLWEGRAENSEKSGSRAASADVLAPRMVHALFAGFPGKSGETITVK